jgi:hypothetical protein
MQRKKTRSVAYVDPTCATIDVIKADDGIAGVVDPRTKTLVELCLCHGLVAADSV